MAATLWKGHISFGLVSFPVRLTSAARAETVHFHMLHKKGPLAREGGLVLRGRRQAHVEQPRKAPVIDLMEALKRSIEAGSGKKASKGNGGRAVRKTTVRRKAA